MDAPRQRAGKPGHPVARGCFAEGFHTQRKGSRTRGASEIQEGSADAGSPCERLASPSNAANR